MGSETTIEAVRLAMGIEELKARVASLNIANANRPDAQALRMDFAAAQAALTQAAGAGDAGAALRQASADIRTAAPSLAGQPIQADEQIADMSAAGLHYQALSEALSRHFGLMRLAISGRS